MIKWPYKTTVNTRQQHALMKKKRRSLKLCVSFVINYQSSLLSVKNSTIKSSLMITTVVNTLQRTLTSQVLIDHPRVKEDLLGLFKFTLCLRSMKQQHRLHVHEEVLTGKRNELDNPQ